MQAFYKRIQPLDGSGDKRIRPGVDLSPRRAAVAYSGVE